MRILRPDSTTSRWELASLEKRGSRRPTCSTRDPRSRFLRSQEKNGSDRDSSEEQRKSGGKAPGEAEEEAWRRAEGARTRDSGAPEARVSRCALRARL